MVCWVHGLIASPQQTVQCNYKVEPTGMTLSLKLKDRILLQDLLTSYLPVYGGGPRGTKGTMIEMHKEMLDDLHCVHQGADCVPILPGLLDMDCFFEACVMVKEHEKEA